MFQLFGGDYCADKDLDKICDFNERFYGVTSYEATTITENVCVSVATWSEISCGFAASRRTRHLLNERSDEQVEIGYSADDPETFPGPQKFASLSIRARSQVRTSARE